MSLADLSSIRSAFPALARREAGYPAAYFDGPGGTQVPTAVTDAMVDYLHHRNANTHWAYATSAETDEALDQARAALADFLGCAADEVSFGANMTTLTYHLSRAIGRALQPGDEVIVFDRFNCANQVVTTINDVHTRAWSLLIHWGNSFVSLSLRTGIAILVPTRSRFRAR